MKLFSALLMPIMLLPLSAYGQKWNSYITMQSTIGYTTNSYLNPYISEWDRNISSSYWSVTPTGQLNWNSDRAALNFQGGMHFQPYLRNEQGWKGGFLYMKLRENIANNLAVGLQSGGSYYNSAFDRTMAWVQPTLQYTFSPLTRAQLRVGSSFRGYDGAGVTDASYHRYDLYGLQLETWPAYQWKLQADVFGNLNKLNNPSDGISTTLQSSFVFKNGVTWSAGVGLEHYQYDIVTQGSIVPGNISLNTAEDRMLKLSTGGSFPVYNNWSVRLSGSMLSWYSSSNDLTKTDFYLSAGVEFGFSPGLVRKKEVERTAWQQEDNEAILRLKYNGDGELYITGDFNNWSRPGKPLRKGKDHTYLIKLDLSSGAYEYKIVVKKAGQKSWLKLPDELAKVDDGFGGENGRIIIN